MTPALLALDVLVLVAVAVSVVTDLKTRKIKNFVTYPTILACLALRAATAGFGDVGADGLASGLVGLGIGGGFFLLFVPFGGMGMGDVKLTAAVGAGVGYPAVLLCLIGIGLAGGVQAIAALVWQRRFGATLGGMGRALLAKAGLAEKDSAPRPSTKIPYSLAIAAGTAGGIWFTWSLHRAAMVSP